MQNRNANHIFAWMVLEEVTGQSIRDLTQQVMFGGLDLKCTFMDKHSLDTHVTRANDRLPSPSE